MALRNTRTRVFAALLSVASLATPAFAQSIPVPAAASQGPALSHIRIDNFGRINNNYFRGAQPTGSDYADLAALGVKTVIDLQKDGPSQEAGYVKAAGMNFFRIGLTTTTAPNDAQLAQFFKIVNDPANQPVFVHCAGGRHRTGTMTALYRMTFDGWTPAQAYNEMKQYRFEGFPDHPVLRNYVYAYHPAPATQPPTVLATTVVGTK